MNDSLQAIYFQPDEPVPEAFYEMRRRVYGDSSRQDEINRHYLLAGLLILQNNKSAGRLCLYHNPAIGGDANLLFGNLECIDDELVFNYLLKEVESYAKAHLYTTITGPVNGTTWDDYRLPLTHFGVQFITDLPQPEYYKNYLLQNGFAVDQHYFTHQSLLEAKTTDPAIMKQLQELGITVRSIDLEHYETALKKLYAFCVTMFAQNVYYSPISEVDFIKKYLPVQPILQPDFVLIAEDAQEQLQGFVLCIPDPYQKNRLVIKTIARNIKDRRYSGLMTHLIDELHNRATAKGFKYLLHAFMHSNNRSKVLSERYDGQLFKEYALFVKKTES